MFRHAQGTKKTAVNCGFCIFPAPRARTPRLTLTSLKPWVFLVNYVYATFAAYNDTVLIPLLGGFQ